MHIRMMPGYMAVLQEFIELLQMEEVERSYFTQSLQARG